MSITKTKMTLLSIATFIIFIISGIGSFNNIAIVNAMEEIQEENNIVNIPDENLKSLIKKGLKITADEVTVADMRKIYSIDADGIDINSLEGLQYCTNLNFLYVKQGNLSDLSPISSLSKLQMLRVWDCKVNNLEPLRNLDNLIDLGLKNLPLNNYDALESLTNAISISIDNCNLKDISFISNLAKVEYLYLENNYIENISGIENLYNIQAFYLNNNEIKSIKPLVNIPKHTKGEYGFDQGNINLSGNLIGNSSDTESEEIKKQIESKGYEVNYSEYEAKNDMHLMKVNGKRYIPGETYNLSSNNEVKLEFTQNVQTVENSPYIDFYDKNYDDVSDYTASCDKNVLTIKVTREVGINTEYHLSMSEDNIQGLNSASILVTGYDKNKEESAKIQGDVNNDGVVDIKDFSIVANNYNKIKSQSSDWDEDIDCIKDGIIDIYDITFISSKL